MGRTREAAADVVPAAVPSRRISPNNGRGLDWRELWDFRELLAFLVWRDIRSRYKQTFFGASWGLLRPLITMIVLSLVFGGLAGISSGTSTPYPLFVFTGLLPWMYFASAYAGASTSVVGNTGLITKAYFPRLYVPVAAVLAPIVDFCLSLVIFAGLFAWYGTVPSGTIVFAPLFMLLAIVTALGAGLWLSAANVRFRDVAFALPFVTQIWMYATPVIYPVSLVPAQWRWVLALNPLSAVADGFRWSVLGQGTLSAPVVAVGIGVALLLLISGVALFRRAERRFADVL